MSKRDKDRDWTAVKSFPYDWQHAPQICVLQDIRDELKRLNGLLNCSRFVGIPSTLNGIRRDIAKLKKKGEK